MSCSMFDHLDADLLPLLQNRVQVLIRDVHLLEQAKRRERGAYVKPGLADATHQFERTLLQSYHSLFQDVVASLRGRNDDVTSGRLHQAKETPVADTEVVEAMDEWDVPIDERDHPIDRSKLAAILALLLLWRSRHVEKSKAYLLKFFEQGRQTALKEIGVEKVLTPLMAALRDAILARYTGDLDRLEKALREGSSRSQGIEWIVQNGANLGEALALLKRLEESERFRIEMFSESLSWFSSNEGYRAGAIEGTRDSAKELGFVTAEGLSLEDLTDDQLAQLPHYIWSGPDDPRCCGPCKSAFSEGPVAALSLDDLIRPQDRCLYGQACRHFYELVED
jgi:hypothetical protein